MLSLIFNTAKYFLSKPKTDENIDDIFDELKVAYADNEELDSGDDILETVTTEGCFYRNGLVTHVTANSILIDDRYICDYENVLCSNLKVGDKVHYMAFQRDQNEELKIRKVMSIIDNWGDDNDSKYIEKHVTKNQMLKKCVVVKVMKREGRKVHCEPSNITFSLDKISSTFVPYVGDWLNLESLVEFDENSGDLSGEILEVDRILPLRSKLKIGLITKYDPQTGVGIVDRDTIFVKSTCQPGYLPCVGDKVVCDSIESDQGIYTWRCLTVVPIKQVVKGNEIIPSGVTNESKKSSDENLETLFLDKHGINITNNLLCNINVNQRKELQVVINNCSNVTHTLNKCVFMSKKAQSQLSLMSPDASAIISLKPAESITYTFKCTAKFVGATEELVIFCFKNFTIGRVFKLIVNVKNVSTAAMTDSIPYDRNKLARYDKFDQLSIIPGIKPCKPPKFITVRSGVFRIPQRLWKIILPCINQKFSFVETEGIVSQAIPHLNETLTLINYRDRFHTLLYLEEISFTVDMQKYDLDSATMVPFGEYLVLKVPGLAEKRPSLILGDRAIVSFKWDSSSGNLKHEGCIHHVRNGEVLLKFNPNFHCTYSGQDCQVTFKSSYCSIARCHNAVNLAVSHLGSEILFPTSIVEKEPQIYLDENCFDENPKHKFITNNIESLICASPNSRSIPGSRSTTNSPGNKYEKLASLIPKIEAQQKNATVDESYVSQIKKRKLIWFNKRLNYYQKEAVRNILRGVARPLPYVIFGPPGTGKTITLCEAILQILTTNPDSRLLVATPSNSSANLVAERLLDSGVLKPGDLVRLIAHHCLNDDSIPSKLLPYCATGNLAAERSTKDYYRTSEGTGINCTISVLGRHRITVGTCAALGILHNMGFPRGHFSHILVDEAGQATEPEIMIPLTFTHSSCGQIILAGDPMQLGPVINGQLASFFGLSEPYLVRLLQHFPYQRDNESFEMGYDPRLVTKLVINYRSLPEILHLPNSLFYDSELQANVSTTSPEAEFLRSISEDLPFRTEGPPAIVFHGINGDNCQDPDSPSWYNPAEATQVYLYLLKFYDRGITESDIGIITPYKKQVGQIRALLIELNMPLPKIGSVEEFQGQERKIIILSTVRSTSNYVGEDVKYALGFVSSPRRLNVAITRARALLLILGNPNLLSQDLLWRSVLNYCIENDSYTGCIYLPINSNDYGDKGEEVSADL